MTKISLKDREKTCTAILTAISRWTQVSQLPSWFFFSICGSVAEWLGSWTCNQQVAGSNPSLSTVECNPGQVVNTHVPVTKQYNLVPSNGRWCLVAGKATIGLTSHWPRITVISGSPPMGLRPRRGRWASAYDLLVEYGEVFTFLSLTVQA